VPTITTAPPVYPADPGIGGPRTAIFDLDRTLLPGSSLTHLGRALVRHGILRPTDLAGFLGRETMFRWRGQSQPGADRLQERLLALAAGVEQAPLAAVVESTAADVADLVPAAARRLLGQHLELGDYCVVLSSSPHELVERVASHLGVPRGVGTRTEVVDGCLTGRLDGPFCHSDGKLARLRDELGTVDFSRTFAYSDAASDLPLLSACGYPVAVNPDRRLRSAAKAAGWPILELH
jgi:HAD superfamily hydrolase (TIGR01490 family)